MDRYEAERAEKDYVRANYPTDKAWGATSPSDMPVSMMSRIGSAADCAEHQCTRMANMLARVYGPEPMEGSGKAMAAVDPDNYAATLERLERNLDRLVNLVGRMEDVL